MAVLLHIDTAVDQASICLSEDDQPFSLDIHPGRNDQVAWLHSAIHAMLLRENVSIKSLEGIAVSIGPGSYTGLRLGLATAKGLCYALKIPLMTVSTLKMIAFASRDKAPGLIGPVIDARRMEVFTAIYDHQFAEVLSPQPMIVNQESFSRWLDDYPITFCGNGIRKLQGILTHTHALYDDEVANAAHLPYFAHQQFRDKKFADLAYTEPEYLKEFYFNSH